MTKITATLTVEYDLNGESEEFLRNNIERAINNAIGNGALTGHSAAEVNEFDLKVTLSK